MKAEAICGLYPVNLWGHNFLQKWNTQINIPAVSETEEPIWVKQWSLNFKKLQALEQLTQEQLDVHHIEESTSHWNSIFGVKRNMENGER